MNIIISGTVFLLSKEAQYFVLAFFAYSDYSPYYSAFTYSFIHSNGGHLFMNMLFLSAFGIYLEPVIGTKTFILLYVFSSIISIIIFQYFVPLPIPCIGASGAVCAILGACLFVKKVPNVLSIILVLFLVLEIYKSSLMLNDGVAHLSHVIGFIIGILFMLIYYYAQRIFVIRY